MISKLSVSAQPHLARDAIAQFANEFNISNVINLNIMLNTWLRYVMFQWLGTPTFAGAKGPAFARRAIKLEPEPSRTP